MKARRQSLGSILALRRESVDVDASKSYTEIGLRSFGRGLFVKPTIDGVQLGEKRVFRIRLGDLVVSNVFAWEGAVGVAQDLHDALIGSHRFMTWEPQHTGQVDVRYVYHFLTSDPGRSLLGAASPGSAGRNRTLAIKNFETIEIPLPGLAEQERIADHLHGISHRIESVGAKQPLTPRQAGGLIPPLISDVLRNQHLPSTRIDELCAVESTTVHPGDDLGDAREFVGLEHIESHTGRLLGSEPTGQEKGRKFRFRPGQVTYGYLRPYLNKVWLADREGLCSVEQFVLRPAPGVDPELLASVLRSSIVLDAAVAATHNLQLPRISVSRLMSFEAPDIRDASEDLRARAREVVAAASRAADLAGRRSQLLDQLLPAARNEIFSQL